MALIGLRRGDLTIHGIVGQHDFAIRWDRLLLPVDGIAAIHLGPLTIANAAQAPTDHFEPTVPPPLDASLPALQPDELTSFVPAAGAADAAAAPAVDAGPDPLWHPPYFASEPLTESSAAPATLPADSAPPGGFIPKSDAILWSGPAIMAFPGEPHDTAGDAPAPGAGSTADISGGSDTAAAAGPGDLPDTAGTAPGDAPDTAGIPDAVTRGDLDPVLTSMGGGHDTLFGGDDGGDLGAAFLPAGAADLPHGADLGMDLTLPPLPPPPPGVI